MSSPHIEWSCSECRSVITDQRKYCAVCHSMLRWTCNGSGRSGLYTNYYRHRGSCSSCIVEMDEDQQQEIRDKQLSIQQEFHTLDDKQRPWSEWQRSDESCVQHTGLDVEQVQELYDMCEEPLKKYCLHRHEQQTDITDRSYLSPMNLLVVTLWYLKHYHSNRYISTELNLGQSTVKYFLTEVLDILHSCVYQELVSLLADLASRRSKHGPQQHHKLIVDSTSIAIPEPSDANQRKAYYYGKSSTNYAIKVQITCDFNHHIVHVSDCYRGSKHDITILRNSGLLDYVEESVQIIADKGYIVQQLVIKIYILIFIVYHHHLHFFFEIVDEKVIDTKEFREFEKNCIVPSLNQWIPTTTTDFEYFMSNLETENSYTPFGDQLLTYTLQEEESSPYFIYCIKHNLFSNSKFAEWWSHLEIFLIFFLNNVLTINEEDQNWFIYLLYQQYQNDNNQICYAPIGFTKVYLHYTYSNKKRPKISQMLILPPYQRKGHGRRLLKSIYNDLRNDSRVQDITESINKVNRLTKEMIDKAQEVRKLTKQRTRHVYENVFSSIN
ncbi:unnamed protein product [Rotaria sp. Silwood1]|nr:unnamed protein product [Rotaria sp. Silwood1]